MSERATEPSPASPRQGDRPHPRTPPPSHPPPADPPRVNGRDGDTADRPAATPGAEQADQPRADQPEAGKPRAGQTEQNGASGNPDQQSSGAAGDRPQGSERSRFDGIPPAPTEPPPYAPPAKPPKPGAAESEDEQTSERPTPASAAAGPESRGGTTAPPKPVLPTPPGGATPPRPTPTPADPIATARAADTPTTADKPAPAPRGRAPRRARLRLTRIDPWSVMKTAFLLSIAFAVVTVVAVAMVWQVLGAAGVWESINSTIQESIGGTDVASFRVEDYLGTSRVLGFTMLVAAIDVVLLTAAATLTAFLYNMAAALLGGIDVTLAEDQD